MNGKNRNYTIIRGMLHPRMSSSKTTPKREQVPLVGKEVSSTNLPLCTHDELTFSNPTTGEYE